MFKREMKVVIKIQNHLSVISQISVYFSRFVTQSVFSPEIYNFVKLGSEFVWKKKHIYLNEGQRFLKLVLFAT